jgi:PBP1b-binding outer membrane lipoprotein LpoB
MVLGGTIEAPVRVNDTVNKGGEDFEAVSRMIAKKGRKEGTLESVSVNKDAKNLVRDKMEAEYKDMLRRKVTTMGFAFILANKTDRGISRDPPANYIMGGSAVGRASAAEFEVEHMGARRRDFRGGSKEDT